MKGSVSPPSGGRPEAFEEVLSLVREQLGHDFSAYRKSTMHRRILRRMALHHCDSPAEYAAILRKSPQETALLSGELLIGVTSFFRDPEAWEVLGGTLLSELLASSPPGKIIRAWVPGCSTGEEAYSLAMLIAEAAERNPALRRRIRIYATDWDPAAIEQARCGCYPEAIAEVVAPGRLSRFFIADADGWRVAPEIRDMIVFAQHELATDPPFLHLDLLSCRNLLIYFNREVQQRLMALFHYSLNPGGLLFLGRAESADTATGMFEAAAKQARVFRRLHQAGPPSLAPLPPGLFGPEGAFPLPHRAFPMQVEQLLLERYAPAAILCSRKGEVLYTSPKAAAYLDPDSGLGHWNLFSMVGEGLRSEIEVLFRRAERSDLLQVAGCIDPGSRRSLTLSIERLIDAGLLHDHLLVLVSEAAGEGGLLTGSCPPKGEAQEEIDAIRKHMHSSRNQLRMTNEELRAANERLQSVNEELTTTREEMQALNEELQTVNSELQVKVDELSWIHNDMNNLLDSTGTATLFLDDTLTIRRYTSGMLAAFRFIPSDVGRSITDITNDLDYPAFAEDLLRVVRSLDALQRRVQASGSRWFEVQIRPYRSHDGEIDGVVVTMRECTEESLAAIEARSREAFCRFALEGGGVMAAATGPDLRYRWVVDSSARLFDPRSAGLCDSELQGPAHAMALFEAKRRVLESGSAERVRFDAGVAGLLTMTISRFMTPDGEAGVLCLCTPQNPSQHNP